MNAVLASQLSNLRRRPGQAVITGLSVLIAAFVVYAVVLVDAMVTRTTLDTFSETAPGTSLVIKVIEGDRPAADRLAAVRKLPGVAQAVGRATATVEAGPGLNLSLIADPGTGPLSVLKLARGTYPIKPGEIALDDKTAQRLRIAMGNTLKLAGHTVHVVGVVTAPAGAGERAYAPDATVLPFAASGYTRIDVAAAPGSDLTALAAALPAATGQQYVSAETGAEVRKTEAADAVRKYRTLLTLVAMFIAVAVIAAALVTTSTFRIVFAQRLKQLALLRAIGAQRAQLVRALLAEGAVIGLISGTIGVVLAGLIALGVPRAAAMFGRHVSSGAASPGLAIAVVAGAVLVTVVAVLAPAMSAAEVPPLAALREATTKAAESGISKPRLATGVVLVVAAGGVLALAGSAISGRAEQGYSFSDVMLYLIEGGGLAFVSLIVLGPVLIRPLLAVAGWPLRRLGPTGRLAVSGLGGMPRRAAAVSVIVALGVALVAACVVGLNSFQAWTAQKLAESAPADLVMVTGSPLPGAQLTRLRDDARFTDVTTFRLRRLGDEDHGNVSEAKPTLLDLDLSRLPALHDLQATSGSLATVRAGETVLSGAKAAELGVRAGDKVVVTGDGGRSIRVRVSAVLMTSPPWSSDYVLAPADFDRITDARLATSGVFLNAPGDDRHRNAAVAALRDIADRSGGEVAVPADARDKAQGQISSMFVGAIALFGITVLIAVVGVGSTTGLSVLERVRELGLLRAVGLNRARLRLMIGAEAALYGLIGSVLGLALGLPMAALTLLALNLGVPVVVPPGPLLLVTVVLILLTAAAGLLPARRAARVSPVAALGTIE